MLPPGNITSSQPYFLKSICSSLFAIAGCEEDVQRVCSNSPEEHLQPFRDKMEAFVLSGESTYLCWLHFTTSPDITVLLCVHADFFLSVFGRLGGF